MTEVDLKKAAERGYLGGFCKPINARSRFQTLFFVVLEMPSHADSTNGQPIMPSPILRRNTRRRSGDQRNKDQWGSKCCKTKNTQQLQVQFMPFVWVAFLLLALYIPPPASAFLHHFPKSSKRLQFGNIVATTNQDNQIPKSWLMASLSRSLDDFSSSAYSTFARVAEETESTVFSLCQQDDIRKAYKLLKTVVGKLGSVRGNEEARLILSQTIDNMVQIICNTAFARPSRSDKVVVAVDALQLQLSAAKFLSAPYGTVPKRTLWAALNALTSSNDLKRHHHKAFLPSAVNDQSTLLSFRILQRLITGIGVRREQGELQSVTECEINQVLNLFSNIGRMDMVHRIVALQERTPDAPQISPITYSILLKGYGRQADLAQVEVVLQQADKSNIQPDVVLLNTVLDAFINCNHLEKSRTLFDDMVEQSPEKRVSGLFPKFTLARPNQRSYNILLNGLANKGLYEEATTLCARMNKSEFWDPVTTNTLVKAAVVAKDFEAADRILAQHTVHPSALNSIKVPHPNVEAYTQLLDAYAKVSNINQALGVMQLMRERGVLPNAVTYTCLIAGFGRCQKLDKARKLVAYMRRQGFAPTTVTYNALISAVIESTITTDGQHAEGTTLSIDEAVDQSLALLREMMNGGVRPNSVTASTVIEAMGRCEPARVEAATVLAGMLEEKKLIPVNDRRVTTALIRLCGAAGDVQRAVDFFRNLNAPDLISVNAFMDACCRCKRHKLALDTFNHYFGRKSDSGRLMPDIISYSVVINSALKSGEANGLKEARLLYDDMKKKWSICPDTGLVDSLLKTAIRVARNNSLSKQDVSFVATILRDAERLPWEEGQLERRKRAIGATLGESLREVRLVDTRLGNIAKADNDDELFRRKGWNKVDSGFRLWGPVVLDRSQSNSPQRSSDQFLESHGWNDVDSGFRIL